MASNPVSIVARDRSVYVLNVTITKPATRASGRCYCIRSGQTVRTRRYLVGKPRPRSG